MTSPWMYRIKMFLAVAIILVFPQLFMHFVGDNPMQAKEEGKGTRSIAIVNEDLGTEDAESNLQLGREVPAILEDDSEYEWTVLSRSSAVNGLKDKKYDAVVYIPSNFTSNILSYDDTQPAKADFKYTVQTQLNAVNREKILRELNDAGSRVNKQMTSLYWNYVSQDMKKVRTEFDRILEKEIEFQSTMVSFYQPGSKTLSDELERQRDMLVQLQSTIQQADENSPQRAQNLNQFEQNLASFVEYVELYKKYQANQQKLLNDSISNGKESFAARQDETRRIFGEQSEVFLSNLSTINDLMAGNNQMFESLNEERLKEVERQINEVGMIQSDMLDSYAEQEQLTLEGKITAARGQLGEGNPGGGEPDIPGQPGDPAAPNFKDELDELTAINQQLLEIVKMLKLIPDPKPDNVNKAITDLEALSGRLTNVKVKLEEKINQNSWTTEYQKLKTDYINLIDEYEQLIKINNASVNNADIFSQINKKEKAIIDLNNKLSGVLKGDVYQGSTEKALSYYALLSEYESLLKGSNSGLKDAVLSNEGLKNRIQETLSVSVEENGKWEELQSKFPTTQDEVQGFGTSFANFKETYQMALDDQQLALMNDIQSIEDSANSVLTELEDIQAQKAGHGTSLLTSQKGINQEITNLNTLMDSLGERQNSVVSSASDLQVKVSSVQNNATVLNEKWSENVDSTKSVRDDVFDVLGNTYVDGQSNGYVYDYLASPLQVSGDQSQVGTESTKAIPPVVILVVILISSLLIGYFTHYFSTLPFLVKNAMFGLLNLIVGLVISLFGLEVYSLSNNSSIQFSIFTILLLTAASTLVRVAFHLNQFIGWLASMGLILFFVSPLLALAAPNFSYEDPMSTVYMSIQYGTGNEFSIGCFTLVGIIALLSLIPLAAKWWSKPDKKANSDTANEAF